MATVAQHSPSFSAFSPLLQEQALRHYQAVIDDPALRWQGLVGRAQVYVDQGQEELAMRDFRQALRSSPGNAQVLAELGYQQYRLGHYRDAIDSYRKVVALRPDESVYWATFGGLLQMVGEDDPAEVAFRRSLALEPNESSLNNLGVILYRKGDYHGAAGLYRRAADLNPNDFYYLGNLGDALEAETATAAQARQAYADAAELAQRFVDAKPDDARALAVLGWYRAQLGQRDASLRLLQQADALGREPGEVAILKAQALADSPVTGFENHALLIARVDDQVDDRIVALERQHRLGAVGAWCAVFVVDALVEQENFDILGAVGK